MSKYTVFITLDTSPLTQAVNVAMKVEGFTWDGEEYDSAELVAAEQALIDAAEDPEVLPAFVNGYLVGKNLAMSHTNLGRIFDVLSDTDFATAQAVNLTDTEQRTALKTVIDEADMPVVSFSATPTGLDVDVDATATTVDGDDSIASVAWDWGDESSAGSGTTDSHTYTAGTYVITCTVTTALGFQKAKSVEVTVS